MSTTMITYLEDQVVQREILRLLEEHKKGMDEILTRESISLNEKESEMNLLIDNFRQDLSDAF